MMPGQLALRNNNPQLGLDDDVTSSAWHEGGHQEVVGVHLWEDVLIGWFRIKESCLSFLQRMIEVLLDVRRLLVLRDICGKIVDHGEVSWF